MKKIKTSVYRSSGPDTTNNGLTAKNDRLDLYYDYKEGELDEKIEEIPGDALIYVYRELWGQPAYYAIPAYLYNSGKNVMFGGNFVHTSDSRFPSNAPISVHDRVEEW